MRASAVEYLAPARFDDLLEVFVRDEPARDDERHLRARGLRRRRRRPDGTAKQTIVLIDRAPQERSPTVPRPPSSGSKPGGVRAARSAGASRGTRSSRRSTGSSTAAATRTTSCAACSRALHKRVFSWVAVAGGEVGERPATTAAADAGRLASATQVGELRAVPREPSDDDEALLERVALLISAHARPLEALRPPRCPRERGGRAAIAGLPLPCSGCTSAAGAALSLERGTQHRAQGKSLGRVAYDGVTRYASKTASILRRAVSRAPQALHVADLGRVPVLRQLVFDDAAVGDDVRAVLGEGPRDVLEQAGPVPRVEAIWTRKLRDPPPSHSTGVNRSGLRPAPSRSGSRARWIVMPFPSET